MVPGTEKLTVVASADSTVPENTLSELPVLFPCITFTLTLTGGIVVGVSCFLHPLIATLVANMIAIGIMGCLIVLKRVIINQVCLIDFKTNLHNIKFSNIYVYENGSIRHGYRRFNL